MRSSVGGKKSATRTSPAATTYSPAGGTASLTPAPQATVDLRTSSPTTEASKPTPADHYDLAEVLPALPNSMSYAPVSTLGTDASSDIDLTGRELASFALSLSPGKLSQTDLKAAGILLMAQAAGAGQLKEANSALTTLTKLVAPPAAGKTVTNNTVIIGALERIRQRQGVLEGE